MSVSLILTSRKLLQTWEFKFPRTFWWLCRKLCSYGKLNTQLGSTELDLNLDIQDGSEKAEYSGELTLIDFDLGKWSDNPDIGIVNFESYIDEGRGLTQETAFAKLDASVLSFRYKVYVVDIITLIVLLFYYNNTASFVPRQWRSRKHRTVQCIHTHTCTCTCTCQRLTASSTLVPCCHLRSSSYTWASASSTPSRLWPPCLAAQPWMSEWGVVGHAVASLLV